MLTKSFQGLEGPTEPTQEVAVPCVMQYLLMLTRVRESDTL